MRKTPFVNKEYYHIFNRGVDKERFFLMAMILIGFYKVWTSLILSRQSEAYMKILLTKNDLDIQCPSQGTERKRQISKFCLLLYKS